MNAATPMSLTTFDCTATRPDLSVSGDAGEYLGQVASGDPTRSLTKRSMDVVGSLLGLILLSLIMVPVALLIRWQSRGPILFRQKRLGLNGREFTCLKFRTMVPDAESRLRELESRNESAGGVLFKIKDDPRVTRLGGILRKTSIDELPQLLNVLRGDMSLVGPRPLQLRDCEKLEQQDPDGYARRLSVLPGLTGPWQVGGRSEVDGGQMVGLDLEYVENWSVWVDLQIILKTVVVVLGRRGAC